MAKALFIKQKSVIVNELAKMHSKALGRLILIVWDSGEDD